MAKLFSLLVVLGIVPWTLGLPWAGLLKSRCVTLTAYGVGYFLELALFQVVASIGIFTCNSLRLIVLHYSVALAAALVFTIIYSIRHHCYSNAINLGRRGKLTAMEWVMLIGFLLLLGLQIAGGVTYDITYMSYDDATYTVFAVDAIDTGRVGMVLPYTGEASGLEVLRCMQTSLLFPAYLSVVSGLPVAVVVHTAQYIQSVLLSYCICSYMATELFNRRENQLLFLLFVSILYIFGYHSHYSLAFRLLGPNYQGKAVLAVSLSPLILTIYTRKLAEPYDRRVGVLLLLLSLSGIALTLWSVGTIIVICTLPVCLSLIWKGRDWRYLRYILWSVVMPTGAVLLYVWSWYIV